MRISDWSSDVCSSDLPLFITNPSRFRRARGFRVERIRALLGIDAKADIDAWLASLRRLVRAGTRAFGATKELAGMIAAAVDKPESLDRKRTRLHSSH